MIKSNPKTKRIKLGLNNKLHYFVSFAAIQGGRQVLCNSLCTGKTINYELPAYIEKSNPDLSEVILINYKQLTRYEHIKLLDK